MTNTKDNCAEFLILQIQHILKYILPILDQSSLKKRDPLLPSKHFKYALFKVALLIMTNPSLSKDKDTLITNLKSQTMANNYISPVWQRVGNSVTSLIDATE